MIGPVQTEPSPQISHHIILYKHLKPLYHPYLSEFQSRGWPLETQIRAIILHAWFPGCSLCPCPVLSMAGVAVIPSDTIFPDFSSSEQCCAFISLVVFHSLNLLIWSPWHRLTQHYFFSHCLFLLFHRWSFYLPKGLCVPLGLLVHVLYSFPGSNPHDECAICIL